MLRPPRRTYGNFGYHLAIKASQVDALLRQEDCGRRDAEPFFVLVVNIKRPD